MYKFKVRFKEKNEGSIMKGFRELIKSFEAKTYKPKKVLHLNNSFEFRLEIPEADDEHDAYAKAEKIISEVENEHLQLEIFKRDIH